MTAYSGCTIVAPADAVMSGDLDAPDRMRVADQIVKACTLFDIPDSQASISCSGYSDRTTVEDLETPDRRSVPVQCM